MLIKPYRSLLFWHCILVSTLLTVAFGTQHAFAAPVTVTREYSYQASEADSKLTSRTIALEQVKRMLLEELGTYLVSNTEVKDAALTKDEIITYTAGWVATVIINEHWDGKEYYLKAKITADSNDVAKAVAFMHEDHEKSSELKKLKKQSNDALQEVERLKKELAILKTSSSREKKEKIASLLQNYGRVVARLTTDEQFETTYDGQWAVSLSCDDFTSNGIVAKGYLLSFLVDVKDGRLIGQFGKQGKPASLVMFGIIKPGGSVDITTQGRTGKSEYTIAHVAPNRLYSYRMRGTFSGNTGRATRLGIRPCEATFFKQ